MSGEQTNSLFCKNCEHEHLTESFCARSGCPCDSMVFIDPFAPKGPHPGTKKVPVCLCCKLEHGSTTKYRCPEHGVLCTFQTSYVYKIVETNGSFEDVVDHSTCNGCQERVEQIKEKF